MLAARQLAGPGGPASSLQKRGRKPGRQVERQKYSEQFEQRVCDAYSTGEGVRSIARRLRIPPASVSTIVKRHGIQRSRAGSLRQQILAAWQPGLSPAAIAKEVRSSSAYVGIVLKECGRLAAKVTSVLFVASVVWSSVMSQPAKAYRLSTWQVLNLPAEELHRLEAEGPRPAHIPATIDVSKLTADSQLALISISGHPACQVMTKRMRQSTLRFNVYDFAVLQDLRLAERAPGARWHTLTPDGRHYAPIVAQRIAIETGIHAIYCTGSNINYRTSHCTCGWSTRLYSRKFNESVNHEARIARHLAEAADAIRPRVE